MKLVFTESAWIDYLWFQDNDKKLLKRIKGLIKEVQRTPFEGMGKPELLRANLTGFWSRRIDLEHRLVYKVTETERLFLFPLDFIMLKIKQPTDSLHSREIACQQ